MNLLQLRVKNFGLIADATINFGDLTFFIGLNGHGKGILLQLIKLLVDKNHIRKTIEQYGFVWGKTTKLVLERYFGEGMSGIQAYHIWPGAQDKRNSCLCY